MYKLRSKKFVMMALVGLWLLAGCGDDSYSQNHESNGTNYQSIDNVENAAETGDLLAAESSTEADDSNTQETDDIRGTVMETSDNRIEIREQISELFEDNGEEYDLVFDAPEEDGWQTITFNETTIFEVVEFNSGGVLGRSEGTSADIYLDDNIHAFGQLLGDELAAERIEIWVLIH